MRILGFLLTAGGLSGLLTMAIVAVRHWRGKDRERIKDDGTNELTVREAGPHSVEAVATHFPTEHGYGFLLGGQTIRRFVGPLRRQRAEAWLRRMDREERRTRPVERVLPDGS